VLCAIDAKGSVGSYYRGADPLLYQFGHGLSYTTFVVEVQLEANASVCRDPAGTFDVPFRVTNTGAREGTELVQAYVTARALEGPNPPPFVPAASLVQFLRVSVPAGAAVASNFTVQCADLRLTTVAAGGNAFKTLFPGQYDLLLRGGAPDSKSSVGIAVPSAM
jgi:beta-glucosidase